jgi:hypothetical protein
MPAAPERTEAEIKQRQEAPLKHGGAAARRSLTSGDEFTGIARVAELAVQTELEVNGRMAIVERAALRLQAAADLYFAAFSDAGEKGNSRLAHSYVKTFGWLQAKALSAWSQLRDEQADEPDALDYEQLQLLFDEEESEHIT